MKKPKASEVKKYLSAILKINKKYVTSERLSKKIGIWPEIINESLSYFEPTLPMDPGYNLMVLVPTLKKYIEEEEEERANALINRPKAASVKKKDVDQYQSIYDFIYKKMTNAGGLLDKNVILTDSDLKILKKLITEEQNRRKK